MLTNEKQNGGRKDEDESKDKADDNSTHFVEVAGIARTKFRTCDMACPSGLIEFETTAAIRR